MREEEQDIVSDSVIQAEKIRLRKTYRVLDGQQFLFDSYLPKCWYFEIVECFRRLALTALPILFLRSSVVQIVLVLLVSLAFAALYMTLHPYERRSDNSVAILSQWAVSLTVVGALCMKVNSTSQNGDEFDSLLVAVILIVVNSAIFVFTIVASVQEEDITEEYLDDFKDDGRDSMRNSTAVSRRSGVDSKSIRHISAEVDSDDDTIDGRDSRISQDRVMANVKNITSLHAFEKGVSRNKQIEQHRKEAEELKEAERRKRKSRKKKAKESSDGAMVENPIVRDHPGSGPGFEMSPALNISRGKDSDDEDY